jgi:hypothetical protein
MIQQRSLAGLPNLLRGLGLQRNFQPDVRYRLTDVLLLELTAQSGERKSIAACVSNFFSLPRVVPAR